MRWMLYMKADFTLHALHQQLMHHSCRLFFTIYGCRFLMKFNSSGECFECSVACLTHSVLLLVVEAATNHTEDFKTWRERPAEFHFDGRYPLLEVFDRAAEAWKGAPSQHVSLLCRLKPP